MLNYRDEGTLVIKTTSKTGVANVDKKPANVEMAEIRIKFSDFRNVGGVQFPFTWTQTIGGKPFQTVAVTNYEINPANIAEKFKTRRVLIKNDDAQ